MEQETPPSVRRTGRCSGPCPHTAEPTVKPSFLTVRSASDDDFAINETTRHQYYCTMQAEACDEDVLDDAMNRRRARAMLEKQQQRHRGFWVLGACGAVALALWLLLA